MNNDMIERYIYAVTKSLPEKTKEDVAKELRSIISDMLDGRCGGAEPSEQDVRAVLKELGTPDELAEKYDPDSGKCLIGGEYYKQYKLVLKIVLVSVAFGMAIAGTISAITAQSVWYEAFAQWIATIVDSLVSAFTFVTLLFAIFDHKGVKINVKHRSIDDLPPVPKEKAMIKRSEPIVGMVVSAVFAVIFIVAPQVICVSFAESGTVIPVFNVDAMRASWYLIIMLAALGIIDECMKLIDGRYSRRVMAVTVVTDILSVGVSFLWLMNRSLMNPEVHSRLSNVFTGSSDFILQIISNIQYYFLGLIVFSLLIEMVTTIVKTLKYGED